MLLGAEDAIISDALNHASIIDGVRLCKAERHRYANGDMTELEAVLKKTQDKRLRLIATDGVFSMDGYLAKLDQICDLADRYDAMVMVDDSHATGFIGPTGRGTPEHHGVMNRIDVLTSTLGKALGGASGGFTTGRKEIVELLRQRSRPYLFSNTLAPAVAGASIAVFDLLDKSGELRERVMGNARRFREGMAAAGFTIKDGFHPIVPVMIGDAKLASDMASKLLAEGIYVIGFSYPGRAQGPGSDPRPAFRPAHPGARGAGHRRFHPRGPGNGRGQLSSGSGVAGRPAPAERRSLRRPGCTHHSRGGSARSMAPARAPPRKAPRGGFRRHPP